jgi:hypothetical protein
MGVASVFVWAWVLHVRVCLLARCARARARESRCRTTHKVIAQRLQRLHLSSALAHDRRLLVVVLKLVTVEHANKRLQAEVKVIEMEGTVTNDARAVRRMQTVRWQFPTLPAFHPCSCLTKCNVATINTWGVSES